MIASLFLTLLLPAPQPDAHALNLAEIRHRLRHSVPYTGPQAPTDMFKDLPKGHWAYGEAERLTKHEVLWGFPTSGEYGHGRGLTRYEFAAMIDRSLQFLWPPRNSDRSDGSRRIREKIDAQDATSLLRLMHEFRAEIEVLGGDNRKGRAGQLRRAVMTGIRSDLAWIKSRSEARQKVELVAPFLSHDIDSRRAMRREEAAVALDRALRSVGNSDVAQPPRPEGKQ